MTTAMEALESHEEFFPTVASVPLRASGASCHGPHCPSETMLPSSFFSMQGMAQGMGKTGAMAAGGAIGGAMFYGMCKMKCPGAKGGFLSNMPMGSVLSGMGNMAKSAAGHTAGAVTGEDNEWQKTKIVGDSSDDEDKGPDDAEEEEQGTPPVYGELEKTENSACRLNCKIKALMAAAAAAYGAGKLQEHVAGGGGMAMPLDADTVGPWSAILNKYDPKVVERLQAAREGRAVRRTAKQRRELRKYWRSKDGASSSEEEVTEQSHRRECRPSLL